MPRPSNTDKRRSEIARGLVKVMARHGYDGASIGEIAAAAGLSSGLVHYHFESKQEILLEVVRALADRQLPLLDEGLQDSGPDARRQLRFFIDFHLKLGPSSDSEAVAVWTQLSGEAIREPRVKRELKRVVTALASRLERVIRDGCAQRVFRCNDVLAATAALMATIQGYLMLSVTVRELIPMGSAARSTKAMARGLLKEDAS